MVNVLNILGAPQKLVSLIKIMENVAKFEKELYKVSAVHLVNIQGDFLHSGCEVS